MGSEPDLREGGGYPRPTLPPARAPSVCKSSPACHEGGGRVQEGGGIGSTDGKGREEEEGMVRGVEADGGDRNRIGKICR